MKSNSKLRWMPLDNAAKIYPAARSRNWSNVFRVSATLTEEIDLAVMQSALDVVVHRFPSIAVRLRRGAFWYYLEELSHAPKIRDESSYPLTRMNKKETRKCALRVIVYKNRVAVEIFHSLTDGNGAMVFLKTLLAEYIEKKYAVTLPNECGILSRSEMPSDEELEDCFLKHAAPVSISRNEKTAWKITGEKEDIGFINLTCFEMSVEELLKKAHEHNVTLTAFLCACVMMAIQNLQKKAVSEIKKRKPIKVLLPVNLRPLFNSKTLRNFVFYTTPEILPYLGDYSLEEICNVVKNHMGAEVTQKIMSLKIAANVKSEQAMVLRLAPLFLKNIVMKMVFNNVGEKKSCLSLSNLGAVKLPSEMEKYVTRLDFILGIQSTAPYNCGVLSFKDTLYMNFVRDIKNPLLESAVFEVFRDLGLEVKVLTNAREDG